MQKNNLKIAQQQNIGVGRSKSIAGHNPKKNPETGAYRSGTDFLHSGIGRGKTICFLGSAKSNGGENCEAFGDSQDFVSHDQI